MKKNWGYWLDKKNQKDFLLQIGANLGYEEPFDYYQLTTRQIKKNQGGGSLLSIYNGSHILLIKTLLNNYDWKDWLFKFVKRNFWSDIKNQKEYLDWLFNELKYKKIEDWYGIKKNDFIDNHGRSILSKYHNSPILVIKTHYPTYDWKEWQFNMTSNHYWDNIDNHFKFVKWFEQQYNILKHSDWYKIKVADIIRDKGMGLLAKHYNSSIKLLLKKIYPEFIWLDWEFIITTKGYWKKKENHRKYLDWLGLRLGFKSPEDWYHITGKDFEGTGTGLLFHYYKSSFYKLIKSVYFEYDWKEWMFDITEFGWFENIRNCKKYVSWFESVMGVAKCEDWYHISSEVLVENYGIKILSKFNSHPYFFLIKVYPNFSWKPWLFDKTPKNTFDIGQNITEYVEWLGNKLGINDLNEWYEVSYKSFVKNNGSQILIKFKNQYNLLKYVYPDFIWNEWLFNKTIPNFWKSKENQEKYINWLKEKYNIHYYEDWYSVKWEDIRMLQREYRLSTFKLFKKMYPDFEWNEEKFLRGQKNQKLLYYIVKEIFPHHDIFYNYKHSILINPNTNKRLELDIFLPDLNLGIEYQGEQHFEAIQKFGGPVKFEYVKKLDSLKQSLCNEKGIILIHFKYSEKLDFVTVKRKISKLLVVDK